MAEALDLPPERTAPYVVDAAAGETPPGGLPQAGETRLTFPNNHLQYAITWYGLAATCVAVFLVFARRRLRDRPDGAGPGADRES
jgi:surfeit locus 1 family protein